MSKDIIFNKKPTRKPKVNVPIRASTYPWPFNRKDDMPQLTSFKKDAIDLNNYRILKPSELLQRGDLLWSEESETYYETVLIGKPKPIYNTVYYRKKDLDGYKLLYPSDILEEGDEFQGRIGEWTITGNVGQEVGCIHKYRRPIKKEKFSDAEIEKAKQHYGVSHRVPLL